MSKLDDSKLPAQHSGVDTLISELKEKGVKHGQEEARKIISEAEERAHFIVSQAELEAQDIKADAEREAEKLKHSAEEAIQVAARDLILDMKATLQQRLAVDLRHLVEKQFQQEDFIARILLAVAGESREQLQLDQISDLMIQLPANIKQDEPARIAEKFAQDKLGQWLTDLTGQRLREGLTFSSHQGSGIKIKWANEEMEVDLTTEAITELLLEHIQPRFRALLDAIWK